VIDVCNLQIRLKNRGLDGHKCFLK
jgi:hypothetical protein